LVKLTAVLTAAMLLPACLYAHDITLEAEDYTYWHNEGNTTIYETPCSGASGGYAMEGFDYVGDWIEYELTVFVAGAYADTLRSACLYGLQSHVRVTIYGGAPGGGDITSEYQPVGMGIG